MCDKEFAKSVISKLIADHGIAMTLHIMREVVDEKANKHELEYGKPAADQIRKMADKIHQAAKKIEGSE